MQQTVTAPAADWRIRITLDDVRHALDRLGHLPGHAWGRSQFYTRCPAHKGRRTNLSCSEGRNGQALITCHKGCTYEDVLRALDLWVDLAPRPHLHLVQPHRDDVGNPLRDVDVIADPPRPYSLYGGWERRARFLGIPSEPEERFACVLPEQRLSEIS